MKEYRIDNLSCANCAQKFENNLNKLPDVKEAKVNFGASKVIIEGDVTEDDIDQAGAFDGIKVQRQQQSNLSPKTPFYKKRENIVAVIALVFVVIGYIVSLTAGEKAPLTIFFFVVAILIGGTEIFIDGFKNSLKLDFDMKTLMTIAIIGAAIIGEWKEAAVVVFLFAVSEALEAYSMDKARQSIRSLMDIAPPKALIRRQNQQMEVPTEAIEIGDLLLVKPGEKIAMDGVVIKGQSTVNQAAITGESMPVSKGIGNEVFAGTLNDTGALEVEVTKHVEDTTIAKIIHLVEEAQAEKAPSQQFVDRFAKYYTPAIMIIALLIAVIPSLITGDWARWVYQGLAVLVVGCPCALIISTPVAIVTAIGNAAKQGVLIKGGIHLEELGHVDAIAFDKTGTLTKGVPTVTTAQFQTLENRDVLAYIIAVERSSQHPLASAVIDYAHMQNTVQLTSNNFQSVTGKGVRAQVNESIVQIGSVRWIAEETAVSKELEDEMTALQNAGNSLIVAAIDGQFAGYIAIADQLREDTVDVLQKLKRLGIKKLLMLTGDAQSTAQAIGKKLPLDDIKADLMPADKLVVIRDLQQVYKVAMVGDGVNDAPALASASVGIAMGGAGTDTALETADVALMADDLQKLPYSVGLSRKTLTIIKQNITFALALKIIALLLVIPGWLTLWIAIFADMGATLIVVFNSLRLLKIQK
ncbi:copper-translocating P-type ATPase [Kurthia sibirica]|uniref:Cd(2+)-exporting ATPase n=2 Tax=Kurthia sibirica TaxID=202750 RepID=A0A2U3AK92_9BACL|nr:heavy metal translocating P-type ATPase [Kurthia sibirica]PWI24921.1 cadmium-translocating P-type ATPase [Kurthia sibirica]GEK33169.1 copper-translocating P-type ATPase [Kurthia sibirica]